MKRTKPHSVQAELNIDQKNFIGLSLVLLLAVHFTLTYLTYTYYPDSLLDRTSPGYWMYYLNHFMITSIVLLDKRMIGWSWSQLGLAKPKNLWQSLATGVAVFAALFLFAVSVSPILIETFGALQNVSHLNALSQNLPLFIWVLVVLWITSAFLEELIFRAFFINSLDHLLGKNPWSTWIAVAISALIFGMIHAYQGITGILTTAAIGLIFGVAYILNGRRIWPLILVHGIFDTITLTGFYNS